MNNLNLSQYANIHYTGSVKGYRAKFNMPASKYKAIRIGQWIYFVPKTDIKD